MDNIFEFNFYLIFFFFFVYFQHWIALRVE